MDRIDADREDFGVEPLEYACVALQTGEFGRSDRGEGQGVKDQQHIGAAGKAV